MRTSSITLTPSKLMAAGGVLAAGLILFAASLASAQSPPGDPAPLSAAQTLLFDTPHLANVDRPETLRYRFQRTGPGDYTDTITLAVKAIHPDGSKDLAIDYGTGEHHQAFPPLDHFHGNPVLMYALEQDVDQLHTAVGLSKAFLRNRIREAFFDAATVTPSTASVDGREVAAQSVTIQPFAHTERLERIASLQARRYTFVMANDVPGSLVRMEVETPADAALKAPALTDQISFAGVER